jgi:histo-blood group ABO system transferase
MVKDAAFVIIATGDAYVEYARGLIASMHEHLQFDFHTFAFTDNCSALSDISAACKIDALGYPDQTLYRYHTICQGKNYLSEYDQLFYVDADMLFVQDVKLEDIASDGLTATLHPGFYIHNSKGSTEKRKESTAYCEWNTRYYAGGFQGGDSAHFLAASKWLARLINVDQKNNITAVWHDESYWNRLLADTPPAKVLTPSFCFPEGYEGGYGWLVENVPPVLVALDKEKRGNHPRFS